MNKQWKSHIKALLPSFLIVLITLEISPYIIGSFFLSEGYSRKEIQADLQQQIKSIDTFEDIVKENRDGYLSEHIVHPYLGFIHTSDSYYNEYGFPLNPPILKSSDSTINICITGGSVAKQLFQFSGDDLIHQLNSYPRFSNKKIKLVTLSLGGFKQPQQLLALNYFLSLGAEYDYVINIDGFNEVVLPFSDNLPFHIFPSFPRHWNVYSRKVLDKNISILLGKQTFLLEKQQLRAKNFSNLVFRYSNFGLFIWKIKDLESSLKITDIETGLRNALSNTKLELQTSGPDYSIHDTASFFLEQVEYWSQCSRQMDALADRFGFNYLHFLQPNQYYEGSKTLTREELETAYESGEFAYKEAVMIAYPMLVRKGKSLTRDGVNFTDLTQLFAKEKATVYSDKCCHFNKKGYDAIMNRIVGVITDME